MERRTMAQVALLIAGLIVWGYGSRVNDNRLTGIGVAFFALAFLLRFLKPKSS